MYFLYKGPAPLPASNPSSSPQVINKSQPYTKVNPQPEQVQLQHSQQQQNQVRFTPAGNFPAVVQLNKTPAAKPGDDQEFVRVNLSNRNLGGPPPAPKVTAQPQPLKMATQVTVTTKSPPQVLPTPHNKPNTTITRTVIHQTTTTTIRPSFHQQQQPRPQSNPPAQLAQQQPRPQSNPPAQLAQQSPAQAKPQANHIETTRPVIVGPQVFEI
jgi:hypothetical protein